MTTATTKTTAKFIWTQNEDGSWTGTENTQCWPRSLRLIIDTSVTHRTKITRSTDPMDRPSRLDCPSFDAAKRKIARAYNPFTI